MNRLQQKYQQEISPKLVKEFKLKNVMAAPIIAKVVVNMGVSTPVEPRARARAIDGIKEQFRIIAGQHPQVTKAKKSIANFKLREGDPLGLMVTLRGPLMWEFLDKLVSIVLPRVKDFRGVSTTAFDGKGNYSLGIEEQIVFPEITYDLIDQPRGLQVVMVIKNSNNQKSRKMLELLGIPFAKEN